MAKVIFDKLIPGRHVQVIHEDRRYELLFSKIGATWVPTTIWDDTRSLVTDSELAVILTKAAAPEFIES